MEHFPILFLIGRPASGKSEIIDYLQKVQRTERLERFHIADPDVLDDFPVLWTWFEEDHILKNRLGMEPIYTDSEGYFKESAYWDLLIERLNLDYHKRKRDNPDLSARRTAIIEFSRGSEHGGYHRAFRHLDSALLNQAALLYVRVSFAESLRKNRRRLNPNRPDSILQHSLPDEKLTRLYQYDDWDELSRIDPHYLTIGSQQLPYVVFENEADLTSGPPETLGVQLEETLTQLWEYLNSSPNS